MAFFINNASKVYEEAGDFITRLDFEFGSIALTSAGAGTWFRDRGERNVIGW